MAFQPCICFGSTVVERKADDAGRSSQATLLGREEMTIESLYLSPALAESLNLARQLPRVEECRDLPKLLLGIP